MYQLIWFVDSTDGNLLKTNSTQKKLNHVNYNKTLNKIKLKPCQNKYMH